MAVFSAPEVRGTAFSVSDLPGQSGRVLRSAPFSCRVILPDGKSVAFDDAKCVTEPYLSGVGRGVRQIFSDFPGIPGLTLECRTWREDITGDLLFELVPLSDTTVEEILWPAPFENPSPKAFTVLPLMQGALVPNYTEERFLDAWEIMHDYLEYRHSCSRSMYMQFYGQYDPDGACMSIFETRYDAAMTVDSGAGKPVICIPRWRESLGKVGYTRRMRVKFFAPGADYNDLAKAYRAYIDSIGELVTLEQKAARNPKVNDLIGMPLVHTYIWYHTVPGSGMYDKNHPENNDRMQSFDTVGEKLRKLKANGLKKAVVHLDGWGRRGYDNQHPDYLPPAEKLGGWDGMKRLCDTAHELGFFFGTHDQYRDYFYDADSFDEANAVHNADGSVYTHAIWMGGKQTFLCATMAPYYVRRNFTALKEHGIRLDNTYLDVFSCVELDECFSPAHPMTREECARSRMKCFETVASDGILVQSEEGIDWAFPGLIFVHHAPFSPSNERLGGGEPGIRIPLLELVYHDCLITPYAADPYSRLWGYLCGGATYLSEDADADVIQATDECTAWQSAVQTREILRHEFVGGDPKHQKTYFEGGYTAEVDFNAGTWKLGTPEENA